MSRIDRINQQLKRELGIIIQRELSDPRVSFVSVTHVDTSKDLRHARVYFSVLGEKEQKKNAQQGLEAAKGMIRRLVGQRLQLRNTPDFIFSFDRSIEASIQIEETLKEINDDV